MKADFTLVRQRFLFRRRLGSNLRLWSRISPEIRPFVNAKSIVSVLGLAVSQSHEIEVTAEGEDEAAVLEAITRLIESDFDEGSS